MQTIAITATGNIGIGKSTVLRFIQVELRNRGFKADFCDEHTLQLDFDTITMLNLCVDYRPVWED
jgi:hypothetical protein